MTALTDLSEHAYAMTQRLAERDGESQQFNTGFAPVTSIFGALQRANPELIGSESYRQALEALTADPGLTTLLPISGELDPTITYVGGAFRQPFSQMIGSLLMSAGQLMYYRRQEETEAAFVRAVLENYEELLRLVPFLGLSA
jgi:hypothetical protein